MDEQQWLECADPLQMLDSLRARASERKLYLFACACCRLVGHLLHERFLAIVEAVERYVDQQASHTEMMTVFGQWRYSRDVIAHLPGGAQAAEAVGHLGAGTWYIHPGKYQHWHTTYQVARSVAEALAQSVSWRQAHGRQALLLHDLFGNPFLALVLPSGWLAWNEALVVRLAQTVYGERHLPSGHLDPARLAVLADALEESGCSDPAILDHLRSPGPHARGCHIVDAILAKE